jgi:hypothetical protein
MQSTLGQNMCQNVTNYEMEIDTAFGVFMKQTATTSFIVIEQSGVERRPDISRCLQSYNYISKV